MEETLKCWYMRDNHTFRRVPLDVEEAISMLKKEFEEGYTYGSLLATPREKYPLAVHAGPADQWAAFEEAARIWLIEAIALVSRDELSQPLY